MREKEWVIIRVESLSKKKKKFIRVEREAERKVFFEIIII